MPTTDEARPALQSTQACLQCHQKPCVEHGSHSKDCTTVKLCPLALRNLQRPWCLIKGLGGLQGSPQRGCSSSIYCGGFSRCDTHSVSLDCRRGFIGSRTQGIVSSGGATRGCAFGLSIVMQVWGRLAESKRSIWLCAVDATAALAKGRDGVAEGER